MLKLFVYSVLSTGVLAVSGAPIQAVTIKTTPIHVRPLQSYGDNQYYCIAGCVGAPGVEMMGLPGKVISNATGHYQALIRKGDEPMIVPLKDGFEFNPKGKIYNHICENLMNQDFECKPATYCVSGSIGHANVHLKGFPNAVTTDQYGNFSAIVPYDWQACVTPEKEGLEFTPSQRHYTKVMQNMSHQNFAAHFKTVTLSGAIVIDNCPMAGVSVSTNFGGGEDTTDELGRFYIEVPHGWSGDLTPFRKGFSFNPPSLSYTNVKDDIHSISQQSTLAETPHPNVPSFFDIAHCMATDNVPSPNTPPIPTDFEAFQSTAQIRNDLRIVSAIMDERLGAFATHTQGFFVQDYGIILYAQVEPAFTFQGFAQATQPSCSGDDYLDLLQDNALKLISLTSNSKVLDPNQWVVITLAMPRTQGRNQSMTLRARKQYVDAFAANKTDMHEFRRNVQITVQ